jgi:hypothetical protein
MEVNVKKGVKNAFHRSRRRLSLNAAKLSFSGGILDDGMAVRAQRFSL